MTPPLYHYATMPFAAVREMLQVPVPEGAYLAEDAETKALRDLLRKGYRWIRTDGDHAVFEKCLREGLPARWTPMPDARDFPGP